MGESQKLTTRSEVGNELICFVRNIEGTALGNDLGGTIDTSLLKKFGGNPGGNLWGNLGGNLGVNLGGNLWGNLGVNLGGNLWVNLGCKLWTETNLIFKNKFGWDSNPGQIDDCLEMRFFRCLYILEKIPNLTIEIQKVEEED